MSDIIHLLPDHIANQIAAGEVIQRPASAVKELLENAVDAGADEIRLIIKDAGKALVQVIDNGKGMSETDARMAFERHATSKISSIEDLFRIRTMGFRGEALASIAAVAQVELKTKRREDEAGTYLEVENSRVVRQEPVAIADGSSIAMKNLFFNVPARRNFLKSNASGVFRHIVDGFIRVAMANPEIFFSFISNGEEVYHLEKGSLKQRIVQVFGNNYASRLVSVQEKTDYLNIYGFAGKPETAKKTRGDQYFFVNGRFIKSPYLHHAVMNAYEQLMASDSFPMYALFIDLDPVRLDINVHPTKQEIKFEDEKLVYAFVQAAVKHALAQFSISPTLDFDLDPAIQQLESISRPMTGDTISSVRSSPLFQGFTKPHQAHLVDSGNELKHWKDFFEGPGVESKEIPANQPMFAASPASMELDLSKLIQIADTYIMAPVQSGFLLIHQQNAHERILYESFSKAGEGRALASQRLLFPVNFELGAADAVLFSELLPELKPLGFDLESFGKNTFVIHGTPAGFPEGNEKLVLENMLEQYKHYSSDLKVPVNEKLWRSLAAQQSIKPGKKLESSEMEEIISNLQAAGFPFQTATGRTVYIRYDRKELDRLFGR